MARLLRVLATNRLWSNCSVIYDHLLNGGEIEVTRDLSPHLIYIYFFLFEGETRGAHKIYYALRCSHFLWAKDAFWNIRIYDTKTTKTTFFRSEINVLQA